MSNQEKASSGAKFKQSVKESLDLLVKSKSIKDYQHQVYFSHKDFTDKQYYVSFLIRTYDDKYILLNHSTSIRSDRIKIDYYNLEGVCKYSNISNSIVASIFIIPSIVRDKATLSEFKKITKRVSDQTSYLPLTHIFHLNDFIEFLEELNSSTQTKIHNEKELGSYYGRRGHRFVKYIIEKMNNPENLENYRKQNCNIAIYNQLAEFIENDIGDIILELNASDAVNILKNGGQPKSDFYINIKTKSKNIYCYTFSVKNTDNNIVSCHDYRASDFIKVLKCMDTNLEAYLKLFQKYPTLTDFKKNLSNTQSEEEFKNLLIEKQPILAEWAITGQHDIDNLTDEKQIANYLILNKEDDINIFNAKKYISLLRKNKSGNYGTPFRWTYPSKQRGKRIQLKMPII